MARVMKLSFVKLQVFAILVVISIAAGGKGVEAQKAHHVVGDDRGWDPSSDVASWSSGRSFKVGDKIWFTYSAAEESIAEVQSKEEYESCDHTSPIKVYTNGLDGITLFEEGIRYFVSRKPESCKKGLKLQVKVNPPQEQRSRMPVVAVSESDALALALAAPPIAPSGSAKLCESFLVLVVGLYLSSALFV